MTRPATTGDACPMNPRDQFRSRLGSAAFLVFAVVLGLTAALGAAAFRGLIVVFQHLFWPTGINFLEQVTKAPWWLVLLLPAAGGLITGPVLAYLAPEARGPGVPEVILAVTARDGFIRHRITALKVLVTSLLIGCGASVGREGPIVQIGASVGSTLARIFRIRPELRRVCLAAGAAAGISATFNAPIAGTLFALEVILLDIEIAHASSILLAAVAASVVSRLLFGDFPAIAVPPFGLNNAKELWIYLPLGLVAGAVAAGFARLLAMGDRLFGGIPLPTWLKPAIGGLVLGLMGLALPQVLGVGYETVNVGLAGQAGLGLALTVMGLKAVATALCIGSGMSGGIFAPSLVIGAMLGLGGGIGAEAIWPALDLVPAHYALAGMGSVVAATTLAPMTAIMSVFELTNSYATIPPLMIACIASTLVYRLLYGCSVYEARLLRLGISIVRGHDVSILRNLTVSDYMHETVNTLPASASFSEVIHQLQAAAYPHFVVLNEFGTLAGVISLRDLRPYFGRWDEEVSRLTAADLMTREVASLPKTASMAKALDIFESKRFSFLPVTEPLAPTRVVGSLRKDDVLQAYKERVLKDRVLSVTG